MNFLSFFKSFGSLLKRGVVAAQGRGLTDEVVALATQWVKVAAGQFTDNAQAREFVVKILVARGIPEGIARLAVELSLQAAKGEIAKLPDPKPVGA